MRILIKLSGESLGGEKGYGLDFEYIRKICFNIKKIYDKGIGIGIVCGGGNFLRGRDTKDMDRENADYVGMMATIMNSIVLRDMFIQLGCNVYNQSGLYVDIPSKIDRVDSDKAKEEISKGSIIIYGGGTGKPFFSTDTGAALRAVDINANMIIKLTNVDGIYDKDPDKYDDAVMYKEVSYEEVISKKLGIMDLEAIEICRDNNIQIIVTNINNEEGLEKIVNGENIGTTVLKK